MCQFSLNLKAFPNKSVKVEKIGCYILVILKMKRVLKADETTLCTTSGHAGLLLVYIFALYRFLIPICLCNLQLIRLPKTNWHAVKRELMEGPRESKPHGAVARFAWLVIQPCFTVCCTLFTSRFRKHNFFPLLWWLRPRCMIRTKRTYLNPLEHQIYWHKDQRHTIIHNDQNVIWSRRRPSLFFSLCMSWFTTGAE